MKTNTIILCQAMEKAKDAFDKYIEKQGLESAYFSLYLTGYSLNESFEKAEEIRMNTNNTGLEKFQYPDRIENNL